jgi:hypothetical protein
MSVRLDCANVQFVWCRKSVCSDGGNSGSKKRKRDYGGTYGGVCRSLRLARFWNLESGVRRFGFVFVLSAGAWLQSP